MKARLRFLLGIMFLLPLFGFSQLQTCVDFETLTIGNNYGNGINAQGEVIFTQNNIPVSVEYFEWVGGGGTFGTANVQDGTATFGTMNSMWTNNVNLKFDFGSLVFTPNRVSFDYADFGGNENVSVNGQPVFTGELPDAPMPAGITMVIVNVGSYEHVTLYGPVVSLMIGGQEFAMDNICAWEVLDPSDCVDFELLPLGEEYGNGHNGQGDVIFTENDIPVTVEYFEWTGGGGTFGTCHVIDGTASFGTGFAMWTNNINLGFNFSGIGFSPNRVTFDFTDSGGNENISVNGSPTFAGELNMAPMPPGVFLSIMDMGTYQRATLSGPIETLLVGGQEFAIDNICPSIVEDPGDCVDFALIPLGQEYGAGHNAQGDVIFTENDVHVSVEWFAWPGGGGTFGTCHVIDGASIFGTGQAMWTSNINLKFDFTDIPYVTNWISFDYDDSGGNENFSINGFPLFAGEIEDWILPPQFTIGITDMGTHMHCVISGAIPITEFTVGGQEYAIDNICSGFILDPTDCVDFIYLAMGATFGNGYNPMGAEIFSENDIPVFVEWFEYEGGGGTFGNCHVIDGDPTYGTGQAMWTSNINLRFDLTAVSPAPNKITFDFTDSGGHENIGVNGHPPFVGEISSANLGAAFSINIDNFISYDRATIISWAGPLTELLIGGQEFSIDNICPEFDPSIGIDEPGNETSVASLGVNYPNPFSGQTMIPFELSEQAYVVITVYDHLGKEIAVLADGEFKAGEHQVSWEAGDVSHGIYFYQLRTGTDVQSRKMIVN